MQDYGLKTGRAVSGKGLQRSHRTRLTLCFSRRSLLRGALMIVRRTEEGAWK